ncbi:MAG: ABC transporter permease [Sedimentisphaerales bacterium]|nr:ABC transporter permease [Sedimentisphaerales bacterium]
MNKALLLAVKDLRVLLSDKGNIFWVFGFPVLFALFFGAIYSSAGEGPSGMKIAIADEDNSEYSNSYVSKLESNDALDIICMSRDEAIDHVRKGKVSAAVVLKKGIGDGFEALFDNDDPKLEIASDPSRRMESGYLQGLLVKAQFEALSNKFTDTKWMKGQIDLWRDDINKAGDANGLDTDQAKLYLDVIDSLDTLMTDVNQADFQDGFDGDMLSFAKLDVNREREGPIAPFQITFPQVLLWGFMGCTATFAISIVKERTSGTFDRLRIGPIGRVHILGGKGLACFFTCILIMCILTVGAKAIFKMPMGNRVLFVPAALCTILCFVGLMMFICTLGRTEQSVGAAGWAMLMIMGMLGGAMMPLAFMPSWMRSFSHISPVKWGIYALEGAVWRNFTLAEMIGPCSILLTIGIVFFSLGVVMLRKQES